MEVTVEGGDEFANESYALICQNTFRDLGVRPSIEEVYLRIEPREHVFILSVRIGRVASPVKVGEIMQLEPEKLKITDERYAPNLLALLWERYGDRVQQIGRLEIGLQLTEKELAELKELVVYDPREDLVTRILDGMDRILPEGARVRYPLAAPNRLTLIASENPISDAWKMRAEELIRRVSAHV
jgi:putative methanogenesis marker protein 17